MYSIPLECLEQLPRKKKDKMCNIKLYERKKK